MIANRSMKNYYVLIVAALMVATSCNESRRGNDSNLGEDRDEAAAEANTDTFRGKKQKDADFVYEVVQSNYGEIKLAELADQKSRNAEVKKIAQMLLTDHTASLNDLKTVAQAKGISVPVEEADGSKRKLENIAEETDDEFERMWCKEMLDLHESSIKKFEDHLDKTEDQELKAFINKNLPALKAHREHLKACDKKLNERT